MDNIKFLGYSADGTLKQALKNREKPMYLETFYDAVNQTTDSNCCSCCKQEVTIYAVQPVSLPIKPTVLSLCAECISKLPMELTAINLSGNGAPPLLVDKIYESEV